MNDSLLESLSWLALGFVSGVYAAWIWWRPGPEQPPAEPDIVDEPWIHTITVSPTELVLPDHGQLWDEITIHLLRGDEVELILPDDARERLAEDADVD
jgi:hypothetical protein